jgi:TonB family protein
MFSTLAFLLALDAASAEQAKVPILAAPVLSTDAPGPGCDKLGSSYPPAAIRAGVEGDTQLTYRIATDGTTKDIVVERSSGNADLDAASVAGVRCRRYKPMTQEGKPVEVPWHAIVRWRLRHDDKSLPDEALAQSGVTPPMARGGPHNCTEYPFVVQQSRAFGLTQLAFTIATDGSVKDISVTRRAGTTGSTKRR